MSTVDRSQDRALHIPPQNLDAEKSVLGCMMLVNNTIDDIVMRLRGDHFYLDSHRCIFSAMVKMHESGVRGIDPVTLANQLDKENQLESVGGAGTLLEIMETVPHAAHAEYYAGIVRDKWLQRTLINACNDILKETYDGGGEVDETLAKAEQKIFQIAEQQENLGKIDIRAILNEAWDRILERENTEGEVTGLASGFRELDGLTTGFQPSEIIILAARPSMGKTAFVCNCGLEMAKRGNAVLLFSLEQSKLELAERFLCIHAKVNGHKVRQGDLDDMERHALLQASSEMSEFPLFIDDQPGRTMTQITAVSRRMRRQNNLQCVIIDYLQLVEAEDKNQPREQQISTITRRLKFLAKDLNIPVIALSQLNRSVEQREDKRPKLADLRESGAIEQDADVVMFLHRPEQYDPEDRPGEADLIVAKNRSGPTGTARLTWLKESLRFADYSPIEEPDGGW